MSNSWPLSDILSSATAGLGNRLDITLSRASLWANEAVRHVWDQMPHDQQELLAVSSTTSGERVLVKPAGFMELVNLRVSSSTGTASSSESNDGLQPLNVHQYDALSMATGRPTRYMEWNDWIELYPTPDSSYSLQLRYKGQVDAMTELTDVPSVATRFRYAVMLKTKALIADELNDDEGALKAENAYLRYMGQTPSDLALKQRNKRYTGVSLPRRFP